jgi:hypothetical protein
MDYYKPPVDHPKTNLLNRLDDKSDEMSAELKELQKLDRDWTSEEEDRVYELEEKITALEKRIVDIFMGDE